MKKVKVDYSGLIAECGECGDKDVFSYDTSSSEPQCKACVDGFWDMMGDDPCGKDWQP